MVCLEVGDKIPAKSDGLDPHLLMVLRDLELCQNQVTYTLFSTHQHFKKCCHRRPKIRN